MSGPNRARARALAVLVPLAVLFSLTTVALQVRELGIGYLETGEQLARHKAVLEGTSIDPWQYRILSEYAVEACLRLTAWLGVPHPVLFAFVGFRVLQGFFIFGLAGLYYKQFGLRDGAVVIGLSLLAWGMMNANYNSDLQFNTYTDVIFYLLASLALLRESPLWVPPIAVMAALNRETSLLIPVVAFVEGWSARAEPMARRKMTIALVSFALAAGVVIGLRYGLGPRPAGVGTPPAGFDTLLYNLGRYQSWLFLFATLGPIPVVALACMGSWPRYLRSAFWALVPAWVLAHVIAGVIAEGRLFLVPQVLVFIPGALMGVGAGGTAGPLGDRGRGDP